MVWIHFGLIPLSLRNDVFDTKPIITSSLVTPFINVVLIQFYEGSSCVRRLRMYLMNSNQGHMAVIYMTIIPCRRYYTLVTSGLPFFQTVFSLYISVMHAKFIIVRPMLCPFHCIWLLSSHVLWNEVSTLFHVTLTYPGGIVISLLQQIILLNGLRWCLHLTTVEKWLHISFPITLSHGLVFRKP